MPQNVGAQGGVATRERLLDQSYAKIAWRVLPLVMLLWIFAWIDRANVGFAKLQMMDDIGLTAAQYGLGAGILYLGYLLFEVPSNLLLQRIGARLTLARIGIAWGIVSAAMMFVNSAESFYILRVLLGAFEAGLYPGVLVFLAAWFPTERRATVFGLFSCSGALAGVLGGPLAGMLMTHLNHVGGLAGWQWLFAIEGGLTVILGVLTLFFLTDSLDHARWLTSTEREAVREDLARDIQQIGPRETRLLPALCDPRVWLFSAAYFCVVMGVVTAAFWGPSIIHDAGIASTATIGWIMGAISLGTAAGMVLNGIHSDRVKEFRFHAVGALLLCAGGLGVLGFVVPGNSTLVLAALTVGSIGASSTIPVFWQMPNMLFSGTAAVVNIALINSIGNLGGFAAPYILGLVKQATGSVSVGLWIVAVAAAVSALGMAAFGKQVKAAQPAPAAGV